MCVRKTSRHNALGDTTNKMRKKFAFGEKRLSSGDVMLISNYIFFAYGIALYCNAVGETKAFGRFRKKEQIDQVNDCKRCFWQNDTCAVDFAVDANMK